MNDPIYPYEPLRPIDKDIWCLDGSWKRSPFKRRMTVVRRTNGELAIHSAIRLHEQNYEALERLGRVALILCPNTLHADEARYYAERYREARVLVPRPARDVLLARLPRIDGTFEDAWPADWNQTLRVLQVEGTKMHEALFLHVPSRTLIATDLVFHFTNELSGLTRWLMTLNGVVGKLAPSRVFRWYFMTDRSALVRSLQPVKQWDFERVIMSHGTILDRDGKQSWLRGFANLEP